MLLCDTALTTHPQQACLFSVVLLLYNTLHLLMPTHSHLHHCAQVQVNTLTITMAPFPVLLQAAGSGSPRLNAAIINVVN